MVPTKVMDDNQQQQPQQPSCKHPKLETSSAADTAPLGSRQSDYISHLMADYHEATDALLASIDSRAIAALYIGLRFNKRACQVLKSSVAGASR